MPKITKRVVDTIKPSTDNKDCFIWDSGDGSLKGFGIRIKPSGSAAYLIQYRNKEGRTRRLVIGKIGVKTPEEARRTASEKLSTVENGDDPSAERHAIRKSITVAELCELYIADANGRIKASTLAMDKSRINCHIIPLLGFRKVNALTIEDIERFQNDVAVGKTAKARPKTGRTGSSTGGRGVAARTVGMLSTILEFAKRRKIISENPARDVKKFADGKDTRFLSRDEIVALGQAMRDALSESENHTAIAAIRALILTGCRRNEILSLPWEWIDINNRCIRFGDTKTGKQIRPLGQSALRLIESLPSKNVGKWVFPSEIADNHFVGLPRAFDRICARANLKDVKIHTLRHTFASCAAELGFSELTIAGMIGHTIKGVTARYSHVPDSALLLAADRVSAYIAATLDGKKVDAEVITLNNKNKKFSLL
jgi:integrase